MQKRMLAEIQKKLEIKPDGIFGPKTVASIVSYLNLGPEHGAHFIGQTGHESGGFRVFEENLNYSSDGLLKTFPKYFNEAQAKAYERTPHRIASRVYANRMGNGTEESGDGWKHRGFGLIQLTGKDNHYRFADFIGDSSIKDNPSLIATKYPLESARWFFDSNNIWRLCGTVDDQSILSVSRAINVGNPNSKVVPHGMPDRISRTKTAYRWIKG